MSIIFWVLSVVAGAIIVFGAYALLTKFVFNKVIVNKWLLLAVSLIFLGVGFFLVANTWLKIVLEAIGIIILFWFFDCYKS